MKLPIDIPAMVHAATHIDDAVSDPLAVSVLIDDTAPGDLVAHVRTSYASGRSNVRVSITYLNDSYNFREEDDMAVIVAGDAPEVGRLAALIRDNGTPVMVVTTEPNKVNAIAQGQGYPIPDGDVVAPEVTPLRRRFDKIFRPKQYIALEHPEPIPLDKETTPALDHRMGRWIIAACAPKKLAFALAFSFVRRPLAEDAVGTTALENAGIGVVAFIPGSDLPLMTLNQGKMLLQIAAAYGEPMNIDRVKELALVVGGAFLFRNIARQVTSIVPFLGWAVKGVVGYGGTQAVGQAAIEYFEAGGDLVGLANVVQKARDKVVDSVSTAVKTATAKVAAGDEKAQLDA